MPLAATLASREAAPMQRGIVGLVAARSGAMLRCLSRRIRHMRRLAVCSLVCLLVASAGAAEIPLDDVEALEFHNTEGVVTTFKGHPALQVLGPMTRDEDKLVIVDAELADGTIEVELAGGVQQGAMAAARGFVGVAFHVQEGAEKFEAFYLRPTNSRAQDQERRNHSSQYISFPDHPWHKLREETPSRYEAYVDLIPDQWTSVRIVVDGDQARLYVHGSEQPTLIVNDLKLPEASGAVGLWVGPGTAAHFRDLRVTPGGVGG